MKHVSFPKFQLLNSHKKKKKTLNEVKFTKRPETLQIKNNDIYFIALKKKKTKKNTNLEMVIEGLREKFVGHIG